VLEFCNGCLSLSEFVLLSILLYIEFKFAGWKNFYSPSWSANGLNNLRCFCTSVLEFVLLVFLVFIEFMLWRGRERRKEGRCWQEFEKTKHSLSKPSMTHYLVHVTSVFTLITLNLTFLGAIWYDLIRHMEKKGGLYRHWKRISRGPTFGHIKIIHFHFFDVADTLKNELDMSQFAISPS